MLIAGDAAKPLYPVTRAPVIERPVFAIYRKGSDRAARIRQALELL